MKCQAERRHIKRDGMGLPRGCVVNGRLIAHTQTHHLAFTVLFEAVTLTCVSLDEHALGHYKEWQREKKPYSDISWSSLGKTRSSFTQTECKMEAAFRIRLFFMAGNGRHLANRCFRSAKMVCEIPPEPLEEYDVETP